MDNGRPMGRRGMRPAEKSKRGLRGVQRELFSYSERIKLPMLIAHGARGRGRGADDSSDRISSARSRI